MLGFTLLEILIVVIIISILSTLGFVQYGKLIEREYGRNTFAYLRAIRAAELDHHIKNGQFTTDKDSLDLTSGIFDADNYFDVVISSGSLSDTLTVIATRNSTARPSYVGSTIEFTIHVTAADVNTIWTASPIYESLQ